MTCSEHVKLAVGVAEVRKDTEHLRSTVDCVDQKIDKLFKEVSKINRKKNRSLVNRYWLVGLSILMMAILGKVLNYV